MNKTPIELNPGLAELYGKKAIYDIAGILGHAVAKRLAAVGDGFSYCLLVSDGEFVASAGDIRRDKLPGLLRDLADNLEHPEQIPTGRGEA